MSQYQWVIESPEDADGVSTTIVLGFDDTDSDGDSNHHHHSRRSGRQRNGLSSSTASASGVTRSQLQRVPDDEQFLWWAGGGTSHAGGRSTRSEGGSSRRSKSSNHSRRPRRGGPGSSAGASSTGTGTSFGQHNGNGRRGAHRGTPIFTSTYFPDNGAEANEEERRTPSDGVPSPLFTHRAGPVTPPLSAASGGYGGTRTSGSSRSSGGSRVSAVATSDDVHEEHEKPSRTRRTRGARMVPTTITTVCFADENSSDSGADDGYDDDADATTSTTHVILHGPVDMAYKEDDESVGTTSRHARQPESDFGRYKRRATHHQDPKSGDFTATVASLASQARQLRHHLEPVRTPPLAPAKAPEMSARTRRHGGSAAGLSAMPAPSPRVVPGMNTAHDDPLFSSSRPGGRPGEAHAASCVSSYYISPIHQSVAQESSEWSGTPYFFLGAGGGVSGAPPQRAPARRSTLSRKELREREAAAEAEHGFDLAALEGCEPHRSASGSCSKDDEAYDSRTGELTRMEVHAPSGSRQRWQLAPHTNTSPLEDPSTRGEPFEVVGACASSLARAGVPPSRKRMRGRGDNRDDYCAAGPLTTGDVMTASTGLNTSSDEDEAEAIRRRVKRRRLQMVGSDTCGGSKVLGPVAEPVVLPPDMSLMLPESRAETREDLLKSFFRGQALHEDDFRLY